MLCEDWEYLESIIRGLCSCVMQEEMQAIFTLEHVVWPHYQYTANDVANLGS